MKAFVLMVGFIFVFSFMFSETVIIPGGLGIMNGNFLLYYPKFEVAHIQHLEYFETIVIDKSFEENFKKVKANADLKFMTSMNGIMETFQKTAKYETYAICEVKYDTVKLDDRVLVIVTADGLFLKTKAANKK